MFLFFGLAALFFALSIPLAAGGVPPNRLYGFRTPRSLKDERVWYPTNRVAGRNGIVFSAVLALAAAALGAGFSMFWVGLALAAVFVAGLGSTFVSAAQIVNRVDKGGPLLDLSRSSEKKDSSKSRQALIDKLTRKN